MGNPFVHIDLSTTDVTAARKFYEQVFDWNFIQLPEMGGYLGIDVGKGVGGGIGQVQSPDQPPSWTSYVDVADIDETLSKAEAAGGRVVQGRMDVGGMGWLAMFLDPQGAMIGIWQSAAPPVPEAAPRPKAKAKPAKKKAPPAPKKKAALAPRKKAAPAPKRKAAPAKKKPAARKKR